MVTECTLKVWLNEKAVPSSPWRPIDDLLFSRFLKISWTSAVRPTVSPTLHIPLERMESTRLPPNTLPDRRLLSHSLSYRRHYDDVPLWLTGAFFKTSLSDCKMLIPSHVIYRYTSFWFIRIKFDLQEQGGGGVGKVDDPLSFFSDVFYAKPEEPPPHSFAQLQLPRRCMYLRRR